MGWRESCFNQATRGLKSFLLFRYFWISGKIGESTWKWNSNLENMIIGIVGRILCSKRWIPFSRLSYQVYLVHFIVIYYHFLTQRAPVRFTHYERLFMSCGSTICSLILAFFTYLFFEAPFASLIKCTIVDKMKTNDEGDDNNSHQQQMNVIQVLNIPESSNQNNTSNSRECTPRE